VRIAGDVGVTTKITSWYDGGLGRRAYRRDAGRIGGPPSARRARIRREQRRATSGAGNIEPSRGASSACERRMGLGRRAASWRGAGADAEAAGVWRGTQTRCRAARDVAARHGALAELFQTRRL
jgi:hypothetical protein